MLQGNVFIDFFAPWCPPCMRLLPEFRWAPCSFFSMAMVILLEGSSKIDAHVCSDFD